MNTSPVTSTITCPACGGEATEPMPTDACRYVYTCGHCGVTLRPRSGDCCVFGSYGNVPCPPKQVERGAFMKGSRIAAPVSGVVAAGASVVCMASMGAMVAASAAGAAAGMAGMGAVAASTPHGPAITRALRAVSLGALTHVPNAVLQPLLIVLLLVAIGATLWRARIARTAQALTLALLIIAAAAGLYASIYITVSETGYWLALAVLLLASVLSAWSGRRRGRLRTA